MNNYEIVTQVTTTATHDKEYKQLEVTAWKPYVIKSYETGEFVPSNSVFLSYANGFNFLVPRPKPRPLTSLDRQVELYLSMYFKIKGVSTKTELKSQVMEFLKENVFTSEKEADWWFHHRDIKFEIIKNQIEMNITGGYWWST